MDPVIGRSPTFRRKRWEVMARAEVSVSNRICASYVTTVSANHCSPVESPASGLSLETALALLAPQVSSYKENAGDGIVRCY